MQEKEIRAEMIEEGEDENDLTSNETADDIDREAIRIKLCQIKDKQERRRKLKYRDLVYFRENLFTEWAPLKNTARRHWRGYGEDGCRSGFWC